jgi:hypothetical protein
MLLKRFNKLKLEIELLLDGFQDFGISYIRSR